MASSRREYSTMSESLMGRHRVPPDKEAVAHCKQVCEEGEGKDGASSRGNTVSPTGQVY